MPDETIWHDGDPFHQVLKVAFVDEDAISVFTYRLCPECGVSMDRANDAQGTLWTCAVYGCEVWEPLLAPPAQSPIIQGRLVVFTYRQAHDRTQPRHVLPDTDCEA